VQGGGNRVHPSNHTNTTPPTTTTTTTSLTTTIPPQFFSSFKVNTTELIQVATTYPSKMLPLPKHHASLGDDERQKGRKTGAAGVVVEVVVEALNNVFS
jgi:hypothetical protein